MTVLRAGLADMRAIRSHMVSSRRICTRNVGHWYDVGLAATPTGASAMNTATLGSYFRSMRTLFWTAFNEPNTTTIVDLTTGRVVR